MLVSATGASIDASNRYLRAKGLAEEAVANSGMEHAIVRSTHAYGVGGLWLAATVEGGDRVAAVRDLGREQRWPRSSPRMSRRSWPRPTTGTGRLEGTWALEGPDVVAMAELVGTLLGASGASGSGIAGDADAAARFTEALGTPVSPTTVELYALPSRADAPDAAEAFGVALTTLPEGLRSRRERPPGER